MPRGPARLRRRDPFREPRRRILVVCEGRKTEPGYFRDLVREEALQLVRLEVDDRGAVPRTLVARAVELRKEAEREAKRTSDTQLRYDEVWCVFDVDEHPEIPDAKQQALAHGIRLAVSNPCFELWLLLHFRDQTSFIERNKLRRKCGDVMPGYDKEARYAALRPGYEQAVRRARSLDLRHERDGNVGENPSTGVYVLTESLRREGREAQLRQTVTRPDGR